jgi:two-component system, chemotaxis family, response regulator Rcp1
MPIRELHQCVVLYAEDDDATAILFQMALSEVEKPPMLFRVTDGVEAIEFLAQNGPYSTAPRPNLVLLDLNMPRKSGFDVLVEVKSNPRYAGIAVFVFSSSTLPHDREKAILLGADCYLSKNGHYASFVQAAESVCKKLG